MSHLKYIAFCIGAAIAGVTVHATPILAAQGIGTTICQGFLDTSGTSLPVNANALCTCLDREINKNLTRQEMQAYQSATNSGTAPPLAVNNKVQNIAMTCLIQAK